MRTSVNSVLVKSPPMTVTAIGARHSAPLPTFNGIGDIASTSAEVVMVIGRSRVGPACSSASVLDSRFLKVFVLERLAGLDLKTTVVANEIGYELRCADPIPFDMEYTRDLGYCAAEYLLEGEATPW
jgi:6-phosphofructokinase